MGLTDRVGFGDCAPVVELVTFPVPEPDAPTSEALPAPPETPSPTTQAQDATIARTGADPPPRRLHGGSTLVTPDHVHLDRWGHSYLRIRSPLAGLPVDAHPTPGPKGPRFVQRHSDREVHVYDVAARHPSAEGDDLEYEIHLLTRPASNVLELAFEHSGDFEFYCQAPLTPDEIARGIERPPDVVGSWAVYHKTARGGRYRAGKAFHIYRPEAIDATGARVWGDLDVDPVAGRLIITLPQAFLDTAVYPVVVDPTFGDTTAGTSTITLEAAMRGSLFTANFTGNTIYLAVYSNPSSTSRTLDVCVYTSALARFAAGGTGFTPPASGAGWRLIPYTASLVSGTDYVLVAMGSTGTGTHLINFDSGGTAAQGKNQTGVSPFTWPDPMVATTGTSIYAIYADNTPFQVSDVVKVTDVVAANLTPIYPATALSEVVTVSDVVSLPLAPTASVSESATVDDSGAVTLVAWIKVTDVVTALMGGDRSTVQTESVHVTDVVSATLSLLLVNVQDVVTVTDAVTATLGGDLATVKSESVHVTEALTAQVSALNVSVTDAVHVTEAVTAALGGDLSTVETDAVIVQASGAVNLVGFIRVVDVVTPLLVSVGDDTATVSDAVHVTDVLTVALDVFNVVATDVVHVADGVSAALDVFDASVSELVTVADVAAAALSAVNVSAADAVHVTDAVTTALVNVGDDAASLADTVHVTEALTVALSACNVSVTESVVVADVVTAALTPLLVIQSDAVHVLDSATPLLVNVGDDVASVSEAVHVTEAVTVALSLFNAALTDDVHVTDSVGVTPLDSSLSTVETDAVHVTASGAVNLVGFIRVIDVVTPLLVAALDDSASASDAVHVTESLTAALSVFNLAASEAVHVTDSVTPAMANAGDGVANLSEAVHVLDVLTGALSAYNVVQTDAVHVTDSVTVVGAALSAVLAETVIVADVGQLELLWPEVVIVTDALTAAMTLVSSLAEAVHVTDSVRATQSPLVAALQDVVKIIDAVTPLIVTQGDLASSQSDAVHVVEALAATISPIITLELEGVVVTDLVAATLDPLLTLESDLVKVVDVATVALAALNVSASELVKVTEFSQANVINQGDLIAAPSETVHVVDSLTIVSSIVRATVTEGVVVTDVVTATLTPLVTVESDVVHVTDSVTVTGETFVTRTEAVQVTDVVAAVVADSTLTAVATDTVHVVDVAVVVLTPLVVAVSDDVHAQDVLASVQRFGPTDLDLADRLVVTDAATAVLVRYTIAIALTGSVGADLDLIGSSSSGLDLIGSSSSVIPLTGREV